MEETGQPQYICTSVGDGSEVAVELEYRGHAGDGVGGDLGAGDIVGLDRGHATMTPRWRPRLFLSHSSMVGDHATPASLAA